MAAGNVAASGIPARGNLAVIVDATSEDSALADIRARAFAAVPEPTWTMDDLTRSSRAEVLRDMGKDPREVASYGTLRIHRPDNGAVTLAQAGTLQVAWQRGAPPPRTPSTPCCARRWQTRRTCG